MASSPSPDRRRFTLGLTAAALAVPAERARAQSVPSSPEAEPVVEGREDAERVATSRDASTRLLAPVTINNQGPFPFLVDTGANRSCLSTSLAQRLNLPSGGDVSVHTVVGVKKRPSVLIDRLKLGDRTQRRVRAPVLTIPEQGLDGVLGIDWLKGRRLVLDFKGKGLEIGPSLTEPDQPNRVIVPARRRFGQLTLVDAGVGDRRISAMIDSGSEISIANSALRRVLPPSATPEKVERLQLTSLTGETFFGDLLYIPFLRLGGLTIGNVGVVFTDAHIFKLWELDRTPSIILGMDLLTQFTSVALDFGRSTVRFDFV